MGIMNPDDIRQGMQIKFKTKLTHDNVAWSGTVAAICDYHTAKHFEDVDVRHQEYCRENNLVYAKETAVYLLLSVNESDTHSVMHAFAVEWIDAASLEQLLDTTYYDIRIYDISASKVQDLKTYIAGLGYAVEIV